MVHVCNVEKSLFNEENCIVLKLQENRQQLIVEENEDRCWRSFGFVQCHSSLESLSLPLSLAMRCHVVSAHKITFVLFSMFVEPTPQGNSTEQTCSGPI